MLLLQQGCFGREVCRRVLQNSPAATTKDLTAESNLLAEVVGQDFVAVVTSRPLGSWCDPLDEALWRSGIRSISCELTDLSLIIGPHVMPGESACMCCATKRRISNLADRAAIDEHGLYERIFEQDAAAQIRGFLPSLADMAAATITATFQRRGLAVGRLRELKLDDMEIQEGQVSGLHGCDRCRPRRDQIRSDRFVTELQKILGYGDERA